MKTIKQLPRETYR